jgi:hypothetical protein
MVYMLTITSWDELMGSFQRHFATADSDKLIILCCEHVI